MNNTSIQNLPKSVVISGKFTKKIIQKQKVLDSLMVQPMTMKEVDFYCGVMRENICRYVHELLKVKEIAKIKQRRCNQTNYKAFEYTANKDLFPKSQNPQLNLF
jgi:hypothetical protein